MQPSVEGHEHRGNETPGACCGWQIHRKIHDFYNAVLPALRRSAVRAVDCGRSPASSGCRRFLVDAAWEPRMKKRNIENVEPLGRCPCGQNIFADVNVFAVIHGVPCCQMFRDLEPEDFLAYVRRSRGISDQEAEEESKC